MEGAPESGETVRLLSGRGEFLGWGAYSPYSQIRARVWSWKPEEEIGAEFFARQLQRALRLRQETIGLLPGRALRLVYGESDGLPGVIADRYADWLVVQFLTAGAERWRGVLSELLRTLTGLDQIYERSDAEVRELEGLAQRNGVIYGEQPPSLLEIEENALHFLVDICQGHKTGFYLDQRQNRRLLRGLAGGRTVLDCFCYTGGFTANALAGGATQVTAVDSSAEALELVQQNLRLNHLPEERAELIAGDVFQVLRKFRDQGRSFDLIVLDPPKFAPTAAQIGRAARGYKDINLLAFKLLRPGGLLFTFSCSGGVDAALFQKIVADAALDAGAAAQIIGYLHQAEDHPVALNFPESAYLKGLIVRVG